MTATVTTDTVAMPSLGENVTSADQEPEVAAPTADRIEKLPRIRRTIATRMVQSLHTAAQLTTVVEAEVSAIARVRRENKDSFLHRTGNKLSYLPFFVKAAVEALADNPVVNSSLDADVTTVPTVYLSLSYDHRIVDGADAARYLGDVKRRLESGYAAELLD
ncbi:hypothetical protein CH256_25250 [Rhodococcus sp. 05-2254-6]|uniref:2-oxo acid dehydrogenase subunit E2 n=1 Tax=Rhodococcus sp. 05-2254-6 TaxID=2022489 RepID=UPI000B9B97FD|nr:hypothetical protein CH256_25250 [Rhodococcus sp. 05-2254-6]